MLNQILLLAALRQGDLDFVPDLAAQRCGQKLAVGNLVRYQDQPRWRPVVVELRNKGGQDLFRRERTVRPGEVGAIAPVLPGAEEKHLDAGKSALLMNGEHIGLLDATRIDALMRLNGGERGEPVAVDGRALEIERRRSLFHFVGKLVFDPLAPSGEEIVGLTNQRRIIRKIDFLGAWRRTALDLIEQTRPRAAFKEGIAA